MTRKGHFPPWHPVWQQTQRWLKAGEFEEVVHDLRILKGARVTMESENQKDGARLSRGWRIALTAVAGVLFFLSFLAFLGGFVVRHHLLDPDLYSEALAETNVYERVYTDLLADPAVQEQIAEITGINIDLIVGEAYAQVVSALYLILPPAEMQAGTEQFFERLTAYLSGETPELDGDLNLGQSLTAEVLADRVVRAATAAAAEAVDKLTPILENATDQFIEEDLAQYMEQLGGGRLGPIPGRLLRMTVAGLTRVDRDRMMNILLGPAAATASEKTRLQIEAALAADDLTSAITLAAAERLTLRVTDAITRAQPRLEASPALNGISATAAMLGETRDSVVTGLNTVRSYLTLLRQAMIPLLIVMLVLLFLIVWINSQDLRSALRSLGWTLFASAGMVMILWLIAGLVLRGYLQSALAGQLAFAGLDGIVDDVVAALVRGIWGSVWQSALVFLIISLIALAFGYSQQLFGFLRRLLAPVWRYRWWVLAGTVGVLVGLPLLWQLLTADARAASEPCNGHVELCDRRANEVAYATSHNSMSISEYGWIWPMHDGTITEQLDAGVRGLLIDTHYLDTEAGQSEVLAQLPPAVLETAQKTIAAFKPPALEGNFLCHQLCGFGYTPMDDTLTEIRVWLENNPREVLFIIIQDDISPADTERSVSETGLLPYIYDHTEGEPWPTLREMIDSDKRLVIMAENEGPPPHWYANAWDVTEETPYTFIVQEQFNCKPNRGDTGKPFFLLNHWIQRGSPNRVDAAIVNEYDFLLARARQCEEERGKMPNFVAVNWYGQGDLFEVVDTLNGVDQPQD